MREGKRQKYTNESIPRLGKVGTGAITKRWPKYYTKSKLYTIYISNLEYKRLNFNRQKRINLGQQQAHSAQNQN